MTEHPPSGASDPDRESGPRPVDPAPHPGSRQHRVRSYVLREGRFTDGQRRAYDKLWPTFGIEAPAGCVLDLAQIFGDEVPVRAEIGFGNGEHLAAIAAANPRVGYLGIEVHRPGIGRLLQCLDQAGLTNVRLLRGDAMEVLNQCLGDACLEGLYVLFPDPWPKTRHHKRRLLQADFVAQAVRVLRPGGLLHFATDWADYAEQTLALLDQTPDLHNQAGPGNFTPRPQSRPLTHFERRGQRLGHRIWDLTFSRRGEE